MRCASTWLAAGLALSGALAWPGRAVADVRLDAEFLEMLTAPAGAPQALTDGRGKLPLVVTLPRGVDARALGMRPMGPGRASVRVAPRDLLKFEADHRGMSYSVWPGLRPVLDRSLELNGTTAYRAAMTAAGTPLVGSGKGVVVGIVDTGLDVTHADFRDAEGHTRVAWLIDFARLPVGRQPELEARYGCDAPEGVPCAVLGARDIDELLNGDGTVTPPADVIGHGTHVASIAAGSGGPERRFVGGAPESTLIIAGVSDIFGGSVIDADIVAGVQFVFDRADEMGMPAVVNLSLGSDFGPHDGTTPIEQALASMVGPDHPGRALIVAAGNSGVLYDGDTPDKLLGVHTQTRVTRGVPAELTVLAPGHGSKSATNGAGFIWVTYGAHDDIAVGLEGPGGLRVDSVALGTKVKASATIEGHDLVGTVYNGVTDPEVPLNGDTHGAVVIWRGRWPPRSAFKLSFVGEGFVDAWAQSSPDGAVFDVAMREGTINVPATHPDLIAVGCTVNRTDWVDAVGDGHDVNASPTFGVLSPVDSACYFTSAGPSATGVAKPDLSAPGAMVAAAVSHDAAPGLGGSSPFDSPRGFCPSGSLCMLVDGTHGLLSGSSMSAPQVTGATALLLERDPALTQQEVLALLQQGARKPSGVLRSDSQLGVGALDVRGAMEALVTRSTGLSRDPDPHASWMSLSSAYLRTEPAYAVEGTVEVRATEGQAADGFEPARLTLEVGEGGVVSEPLRRVGPGLWRFKLTSAPDTGTESVAVAVRLDGTPIGTAGPLAGVRELPIGADRWIAFGSARAYGGCSVGSAAPLRGGGGARFGALVLGAWLYGRRAASRRSRRAPVIATPARSDCPRASR